MSTVTNNGTVLTIPGQKPLCPTCRYYVPRDAIMAGQRTTLYHCEQGCPDSGRRPRCPVYEREPGADDEAPAPRA